MFCKSVVAVGITLVAVVLLPSVALAYLPGVVFSNIASSPTSDVPGMPGVKFNPGTASQFDRPFASPDGSKWIFGGVADLATTEDEIIVVGSGESGVGAAVVIHEGTPTFFDAGVNWGALKTPMGINDAGQFAFSADTTAPTASDDVAARWNGASFDLIAREGEQAPGQSTGIGYGGTNNAVHILANGNVRFRTGGLIGATSQFVLYENSSLTAGTIVAQTDITIPANQQVAPDQSIDLLSSDRFRSDATAANHIYHADLNGPTGTDVIMVFKGDVIAQEGAPLPFTTFTSNILNISTDAGSQQISPYNAHYIFRGSNADTQDWVYSDDVVKAATDAPIYAGATELFDDTAYGQCFFMNLVDSAGNYIVGGVTNAAEATANAVLVYNNEFVLLRENDPVDLNNNGLADDDAYIGVFNNDDAFLTDTGWFFFNADLRDVAGTSIGQAYMAIQLAPPLCPGDCDCDGQVGFADIDYFVESIPDNEAGWAALYAARHGGLPPPCSFENGDTTGDGHVGFADIDPFVNLIPSACP